MARAANGTVIVRLYLREQVDILKQLAEASEEQHDHPNVIKYILCWERGSLLFITIKFIVRSARNLPLPRICIRFNGSTLPVHDRFLAVFCQSWCGHRCFLEGWRRRVCRGSIRGNVFVCMGYRYNIHTLIINTCQRSGTDGKIHSEDIEQEHRRGN